MPVRSVVSLWLLGTASACGSNRPEIPPELLEGGGCQAAGYPEGPYGAEAGDIVQNHCFQGVASPGAGTGLTELALSDFYDPAGSRYEYVLVNTSAIWCSACQLEHRTLPQHYAELAPRGLGLISALFQDAEREPADREDLEIWIETFEPNFPMALDPDYQLGVYASAETAPLNLVVDARTMRIERKFIGDQSAVLWPYLEELLAARK